MGAKCLRAVRLVQFIQIGAQILSTLMSTLCYFRALGGGGMAAFGTLGFAFEGHSSPPPVNTYMCIPTEFKDDICTDYFR